MLHERKKSPHNVKTARVAGLNHIGWRCKQGTWKVAIVANSTGKFITLRGVVHYAGRRGMRGQGKEFQEEVAVLHKGAASKKGYCGRHADVNTNWLLKKQ